MPPQQQRIVAFFERLGPADAERIGEYQAPDASFRDPFNDVRGVAEIARVFRHMFEQLADCRFMITETIVDGNRAFLLWEFTFRLGRWRPDAVQKIRGVSNVSFAADGGSLTIATTGTLPKSFTPSCR